jgi:Tol biopolymer transport system component
MKKIAVFFIVLSILLSGCSSGSMFSMVTDTPTPTITPTLTIIPTDTPLPTNTPTPTSTATPTPTSTPLGSGSGKLFYIKNVKQLKQGDGEPIYIYNIYAYDILTRAETQITNNTIDSTELYYSGLNCSPDGKRIVYNVGTPTLVYSDNSYYWNSIIYIMNSDGTNITRLTNAPQFVGEYDGDSVIQEYYPIFIDNDNILFISNRKNLANFEYERKQPYIINLKTFEVSAPFTTYLDVSVMSMSPDKTKIAFMATSGDSEIFIADLSNQGNITQITNNNFADRFPGFSPDGNWIVFHSDRDGNTELYKMKPDGSEVTRLTFNPATDATASWSPDGKWLSLHSDQTGVYEAYIQNIETGERIQVTNGGDPVTFVRWSP